MEVRDRVRLAEKTKTPYKKWWLMKSCYIEQIGDGAPVLVQAHPAAPVMVVLPVGKKVQRVKKVRQGSAVSEQAWEHDEYKEGGVLKAVDVDEAPPAKPVETHLPGKKTEPVKKAHDEHGSKKADKAI